MGEKTLGVITGPSGVGKTTIIQSIIKRVPSSAEFISTTTRSPRAGEEDGKDYYFISRGEFEAQAREGGFVEWVESYGDLYGTDRKELEFLMNKYAITLIATDTRGAFAIKEIYPEAVTIFIMPGSEKELEARIRSRGLPEDAVERRMKAVAEKIKHAYDFDYAIKNIDGDLESTIVLVLKILHGSEK